MHTKSFTFGTYRVDTKRSIVTFTYHVVFTFGLTKTFTDQIHLKDVPRESWEKIPKTVLEPTLQALLLMIGINYWSAFPTKNINIQGFTLTREQARFWDSLYLNGLGKFFYLKRIDFRNLIRFPYNDSLGTPIPTRFARPTRALLLKECW